MWLSTRIVGARKSHRKFRWIRKQLWVLLFQTVIILVHQEKCQCLRPAKQLLRLRSLSMSREMNSHSRHSYRTFPAKKWLTQLLSYRSFPWARLSLSKSELLRILRIFSQLLEKRVSHLVQKCLLHRVTRLQFHRNLPHTSFRTKRALSISVKDL